LTSRLISPARVIRFAPRRPSGLVVGALLVVALIGTACGTAAVLPAGAAPNLIAAPTAAATRIPLLLAPATATLAPTLAPSFLATAAPTAKPTLKPTPRPTPKATPKPTPKPAPKCHPSYDPCLPVVSDLNCPDVRAMGKAPVTVIGPDDYNLDRDHDGIGCE
jgi:hypothetical protein